MKINGCLHSTCVWELGFTDGSLLYSLKYNFCLFSWGILSKYYAMCTSKPIERGIQENLALIKAQLV